MSGVSQEIRDNYKKKFNFDDVNFQTPEDQFGKIILTREGITKHIVVSHILFEKGFDGIDDVMKWADKNWNKKSEIWYE